MSDNGKAPGGEPGANPATREPTDVDSITADYPLADAAAAYARAGLPVFPVVPQDKRPATPHGFKDATTDPGDISGWWLWENPDYNIGLAIPDGMVVIDIDPRAGGDETLRQLTEKHGRLPDTWVARTGGGGWHYWFATDETDLRGTLGSGVDIKAAGRGYVVAPPSVHPSGDHYEWLTRPGDRPAPAPGWLVEQMRKPKPKVSSQPAFTRPAAAGENPSYVNTSVDRDLAKLRTVPEGGVGTEFKGREDATFQIACNVFEFVKAGHLSEVVARAALNEAAAATGLPQHEIDKALQNAWNRVEPRVVPAPSGTPPAATISPDGYAEPSADDDDTDDPPLFADIAALLSGGLPEPPKPSVLHRCDGTAIFYRGKRNELYGDPEAGKTMLALAGAAEELGTDDGRVVFIDLDGNDAAESVQRLLTLGAPREVLADQDRFRYCQPADHEEVVRVVAACAGWATFAIIDCVGELLPLFGGDSNNADDYTRIMRVVAAPLEKAGAGVLLLDHPAKGQDSRNYGAGGTMAKRRAVTGVSINLVSKQPFAPGQGGMAELWINKDRPGGLAMHCPRPTGGSRRRFAGTFKLDPAGPTGRAEWQVTTDRVTADAAPALDPVIERHFAAAVELGGPFTVYELARRFNRLPGGTPPTDAQKKATSRAIGRLEKQGRLAPVTGSSPRRWTVAE